MLYPYYVALWGGFAGMCNIVERARTSRLTWPNRIHVYDVANGFGTQDLVWQGIDIVYETIEVVGMLGGSRRTAVYMAAKE